MISSFGIILFTVENNTKYFLIGKRADSLQYLDMFNNRCPIEKIQMYTKMSSYFERTKLLRNNFDDIYYDSFSEYRSYNDVKNRWEKIKPHVFEAFEQGGLIESNTQYTVPKGRKKQNETIEQAAIREFQEETNIPINQIQKAYYPLYVDQYRGSDNKLYKTIYYIYKTDSKIMPGKIYTNSPFEFRQYKISHEIEELYWVTAEEAKEYLSDSLVKILKELS